MKSRVSLFIPLLLLGGARTPGQTHTISGTIRDSVSGEALVAATIRVLGSARGTISNAQGKYRLTLPDGDYSLAFSYVGYKTDTIHVDLDRNIERVVRLDPSPVRLAEVVVTGEDPALAIMRRVIERKKQWAEKLRSYQLEAFTRQVLRRDTAIALISESYSTCYWQRGDTLREIIHQKRQTENIKGPQNFAGVGGIINFYDDDIRLAGFRFVGPTSPQAFEYYDFKLKRTLRRTGSDIYDIAMIPKTRVVPLFAGTISIADGSFAVAGINVTPNEAFAIPMVSELILSYSQQFSLFDNEFWMPVDIRINGFFQIGLMGLKIPGIGIESVSSIYDCRVNPVIPDSIFRKPRRMVSKDSEKYDSTFWVQHDVLPLTEEEKTAYRKLDSTQSLEKQFQPTGPLVTLGDLFSSSPASPQLRFNRVEGLFVGASTTVDSITKRLRGVASAGYGFSDKKTKAQIGLTVFPDERRDYGIGIDAYRDIRHFLTGDAHDNTENLFSTILYKIDYFDYYYAEGFSVTVSGRPASRLLIDVGYRNEDQSSAIRRTNYSFLARDRTFLMNPPIKEGTLRDVWLKGRYGDEPFALPIIPRNYVQLEIEHSSHGLGSAFDYTQFVFKGEYHIATYLHSLFLPPSLTVMVSSGTALGSPPPQRYFYLDSPLLGYAPAGVLRGARIKEYSGDTYFVLSVEHNFRNVPFLWMNIPFLYKNSIELIAFGNVAQSWSYPSSAPAEIHPTNGIYTEAGIAISRILGLLRVDFTYRITPPARFVVTIGVAMLL